MSKSPFPPADLMRRLFLAVKAKAGIDVPAGPYPSLVNRILVLYLRVFLHLLIQFIVILAATHITVFLSGQETGSPAVCVAPGLLRVATQVGLACPLPLNHTKGGRATKPGQAHAPEEPELTTAPAVRPGRISSVPGRGTASAYVQ
ncbi:hypothetical protein [Stigmatella erecta]|nr:hypothetical protein [Stigmatella erecta]